VRAPVLGAIPLDSMRAGRAGCPVHGGRPVRRRQAGTRLALSKNRCKIREGVEAT